MTLTEIGIKHGTDKATYHGFTDFYEREFNKLQFHPKTILEVGIKDGASLRAWHEFFPNAIVIGVDINPSFDIPGVVTLRGDATTTQFYHQIKDIKFDLIIDDGSHMTQDQQTTFLYLSRLLKFTGLYIMEDIHTSFLSAYVNSPITTYDWLKNIINQHYDVDIYHKDPNVFHDSVTAIISHK